MTTILIFSFMQYFEDEFASKKVGSGSTAIFASAARTLHALSLILYAMAFFLLETFHGEGTAEYWGWILSTFYKVAGLFGSFYINIDSTDGNTTKYLFAVAACSS